MVSSEPQKTKFYVWNKIIATLSIKRAILKGTNVIPRASYILSFRHRQPPGGTCFNTQQISIHLFVLTPIRAYHEMWWLRFHNYCLSIRFRKINCNCLLVIPVYWPYSLSAVMSNAMAFIHDKASWAFNRPLLSHVLKNPSLWQSCTMPMSDVTQLWQSFY